MEFNEKFPSLKGKEYEIASDDYCSFRCGKHSVVDPEFSKQDIREFCLDKSKVLEEIVLRINYWKDWASRYVSYRDTEVIPIIKILVELRKKIESL